MLNLEHLEATGCDLSVALTVAVAHSFWHHASFGQVGRIPLLASLFSFFFSFYVLAIIFFFFFFLRVTLELCMLMHGIFWEGNAKEHWHYISFIQRREYKDDLLFHAAQPHNTPKQSSYHEVSEHHRYLK